MPIRLYNTLSQTKEPLRPVVPPKVGMYVCGPTVYSPSHVGHMVGPVIFDTIKRYLTYSGYDVTWVVNITDVDDKLIVKAQEEGATGEQVAVKVKEIAERVTADYVACLHKLGVDGVDKMPRATEHIGDILEMVAGLVDKGFAYASGGDVYFDITKAPEYGKLSHRDPDALQAGARVEVGGLKRNPGDFALWKGSKPGEPAWDSPYGRGRPGWHIECSAMSLKLLGEHFDIHGGGLDLVFPHHENEVVQSESYTGKPFASYWLHNGLLTKGGRKISKSDPDTIVLMGDLFAKHDPDTIRALLVSSHYRRPIDFTPSRVDDKGVRHPGRLDEIHTALGAFRSLFERYQRITGSSFYGLDAPRRRTDASPIEGEGFEAEVDRHHRRFLEAMDDDFNTGGALGELFELVRTLNRYADAHKLDAPNREPQFVANWTLGIVKLRELTRLLGLFLSFPIPMSSVMTSTSTLVGDLSVQSPLGDSLKSLLSDVGGPKLGPEIGDAGVDALMLRLIDLRKQLRTEKNFKLADEIRSRLTALGITLEDRADGTSWRADAANPNP